MQKKKNKRSFLLSSSLIALLSLTLLSGNVQAQYEPGLERERRIEQERRDDRIRRHNENMRKYPYRNYLEGLSVLRRSPGVQNCIKWVSWAPVYHKRRNPYIEHALYDIGRFGDLAENQNKYSNADNIQEIATRGRRALDFCSRIPAPPRELDPNFSGGGEN